MKWPVHDNVLCDDDDKGQGEDEVMYAVVLFTSPRGSNKRALVFV